MAAGEHIISEGGCTFGKVLEGKVESLENRLLRHEEQGDKDWTHQKGQNRSLFDRTEGLSGKIHATETKLIEKIHNLDTGIRERIGKSEKKIAIIVVGGGVLIIVVRILLSKVFGISI